MRKFISFFVKYPIWSNAIIVITAMAGLLSVFTMNHSFFPELQPNMIYVTVAYPGASPEEIEEGVILKIEDNLKGLTGIERVSSVSNENSGLVTVEVLKEFDTKEILMDVKNAVDKIASLPPEMEPPVVFIAERLNFSMSFALIGDVDLKTLKSQAQQVEAELRAVNNLEKAPAFEGMFDFLRKAGLWKNRKASHGISKIELSGFPDEEIEVSFREDDLRAYNITFNDVASAIRKANLDLTGGTIKGESEELLVRGRGKGYYADDLKNIVVKSSPDGAVVRLFQVADVQDKWSDAPNRNWYNGQTAVVITVQNTIEEDIISINNYLEEYIENFNATNQEIKAVIVRDGSTSLRQRIALLTENGLLGAFLVLIVLALFLDRRLAFWVALGIPVSFAGMFVLATFYGLTINVISLFGMILVVGILVDDGIVISENIFQKHEEGMKPLKAAIVGTMEVFPAVVSAILTTVVAFGAFFFMDGRLGEFAPNMAFVVIATLLFSLIEGAFILPAHVAHSKALKEGKKKKGKYANFMNDKLGAFRDKFFQPAYKFMVQNWFFTICISIALLFLTAGAVAGGIVGTTFFPNIERNDLDVELKMPAGTRENITQGWLEHIEKAVWEVNQDIRASRGDSVDEIRGIQITLGPSTYEGKVGVNLIDGESRTKVSFEIANMIREKTGTIYGAESVNFGVAAAFGKAVSVALKGFDLETLEAAKGELYDSLYSMIVLKDVTLSDQPGLKEVKISLNDQARVLGLQLQDVLGQVRSGFFGAEVQRLQRGEDEVKVWVRYKEEDRSSIDRMLEMRINVPTGQQIPLRELVTYELERGVVGISHLDGMREIRIEADIADFKASSSDINAEIENYLLPGILAKYPGIQYSFEGQSRQNEKVQRSMKQVMPIVLIIMFAIIIFTFRSFSQAVAVYMTIPIGLVGVAWGHWLHGAQVSMLSMFGIIALIGVMVNDSLVLVTMVNGNLKKGMTFMDAIYKAGVSRFRPILLTSVTTIVGLGPLILNKSFQAQFLVPMAISVAYGLLMATFTTLFLLPSLLVGFNWIKQLLWWLWNGKRPLPKAVEASVRELKDENQVLDETNEGKQIIE